MTAAPALRAGQDLADAYLEALESAGMYVGPPVVSVTRTFFDRIGADGWAAMTVDEQCRLPAKYRRTVGWLIATCRLTISPEYLARVPAYLGAISKWVYPAEFAEFSAMTSELGFRNKAPVMQWSALSKAAGIHGVAPDAVSAERLLDARDRLLAAMSEGPDAYRAHHSLSRDFRQASVAAFHLGWVDRPLARRSWNRLTERQELWDSVPERLRRTFLDYIDQVPCRCAGRQSSRSSEHYGSSSPSCPASTLTSSPLLTSAVVTSKVSSCTWREDLRARAGP